MNRLSSQRGGRAAGFSLIELLIVVTVIGIIAAIAIPSMTGSKSAANEKAVQARLASIGSAAATFRAASSQRRFPFLSELTTTQPGQFSPYIDPGQLNVGGWTISQIGAPTTATLASAFAVQAVPAAGNSNAKKFAVFEDGAVVRFTTDGSVPTRTSAAVDTGN